MSNISCTEFGRLVEQAVESRTPVDSALLRAHAADCAGCRATWLDAILLDGAVAEWRKTGRKILPSVDLADIVLARRTGGFEPAASLETTPFAPPSGKPQLADAGATNHVVAASTAAGSNFRPRRSWTRQRIAASAMVLGVATAVPLFWNRAGQQNEIALIGKPAQLAPHQTPNQTASPPTKTPLSDRRDLAIAPSPTPPLAVRSGPATVEAPVQAMVQGAQLAYLDLANQAARAVTGASALVPRPSPALAPSREENDRWVDDVGHQFEPVGKNLSQAFEFILEAVPADKAPAT